MPYNLRKRLKPDSNELIINGSAEHKEETDEALHSCLSTSSSDNSEDSWSGMSSHESVDEDEGFGREFLSALGSSSTVLEYECKLLDAITQKVLDCDERFASLQMQLDYIMETFNSLKSHFFLIIHNIDGQALRNDRIQQFLCSLVQCERVHLVASLDHVNAFLLWDVHKYHLLQPVFYDVTSFFPYTSELEFEDSVLASCKTSLFISSLDHVLPSLTPNAQKIFLLLAEQQLLQPDMKSGISLAVFYEICREAFLVNSELTLRAQLIEFCDHKLLRMRKALDGMEMVHIPVDHATLQDFVDQKPLICRKVFCCAKVARSVHQRLHYLDVDYLLDSQNAVDIQKNIQARQSPTLEYGKDSHLLQCFGQQKSFSFTPRPFELLASFLEGLRTKKIGHFTGRRSYYLLGLLAHLEWALIQYAVQFLQARKFCLVSVPDIVTPEILESCGMSTSSHRTQVYWLDPEMFGNSCLSGTAEMGLASFCQAQQWVESDLPKFLAAFSRCFRAEVSSTREEKSIYRVHQFYKVEMFALTPPKDSCTVFEYLVRLQKEFFASLGLFGRVLDMPAHELGNAAYQKVDIEAYMPGCGLFGEISSASNCTDYQSRRLPIVLTCGSGESFPHTLNATACAVPRMLIALLETHQQEDGSIVIPAPLRPYMDGMELLRPLDKKRLRINFR